MNSNKFIDQNLALLTSRCAWRDGVTGFFLCVTQCISLNVKQEDVAAHRSLKKMLRETGNVSTTLATLRHSISNIRDRHIGRFHAGRSSVSASRRHKRALVFDDQSFDR